MHELILLLSGAGPIGLVTLLAARAAGCTPIAITDLVPSRLAFAKTLVPDVNAIQLSRESTPEEAAKAIRTALGINPRVVIECTGFESSIRTGIFVSSLSESQHIFCTWLTLTQSVGFGGKVFVIGAGPSEQSVRAVLML